MLWSSGGSPWALPHKCCWCLCLDSPSFTAGSATSLLLCPGTTLSGLGITQTVSPSLLWAPLGPCLGLRHLWSLCPSPGDPQRYLNVFWKSNSTIADQTLLKQVMGPGSCMASVKTVEEKIQRRILRQSIPFSYYQISTVFTSLASTAA